MIRKNSVEKLTLYPSPSKEMPSLRVQQKVCATMIKQRPRLRNLIILGVFTNLREIQLFFFEIIPDPDKIKIAGNVDHAMSKNGRFKLR
jgi:hypothetical protein